MGENYYAGTVYRKTYVFLPDHYPGISGSHTDGNTAAFFACGIGGRYLDAGGGRLVYRDVVSLRDRSGDQGHGDLLVCFRAGRYSDPDPDRRTRDRYSCTSDIHVVGKENLTYTKACHEGCYFCRPSGRNT